MLTRVVLTAKWSTQEYSNSAHGDCARRDGGAEYRRVVVAGRHSHVDRRGAC